MSLEVSQLNRGEGRPLVNRSANWSCVEEERKEGRREEVRSGGGETGIGSIDEEIESSTLIEGRDNQFVRDEVKGI